MENSQIIITRNAYTVEMLHIVCHTHREHSYNDRDNSQHTQAGVVLRSVYLGQMRGANVLKFHYRNHLALHSTLGALGVALGVAVARTTYKYIIYIHVYLICVYEFDA